MIDEENIFMLKAHVTYAHQQMEDSKIRLVKSVIKPAIYDVYADCAWGISAKLAAGEVQRICMEASVMLDIAATRFAGFEAESLAKGSFDKGVIELGDDGPSKNPREVKHALEAHLKLLTKMVETVRDCDPLAEFKFFMEQVIRKIELAVALPDMDAARAA